MFNSCLQLTCLVHVFILWGIQSDVTGSFCSLDFEKVAHLLLSDTNLVYLSFCATVGESVQTDQWKQLSSLQLAPPWSRLSKGNISSNLEIVRWRTDGKNHLPSSIARALCTSVRRQPSPGWCVRSTRFTNEALYSSAILEEYISCRCHLSGDKALQVGCQALRPWRRATGSGVNVDRSASTRTGRAFGSTCSWANLCFWLWCLPAAEMSG